MIHKCTTVRHALKAAGHRRRRDQHRRLRVRRPPGRGRRPRPDADPGGRRPGDDPDHRLRRLRRRPRARRGARAGRRRRQHGHPLHGDGRGTPIHENVKQARWSPATSAAPDLIGRTCATPRGWPERRSAGRWWRSWNAGERVRRRPRTGRRCPRPAVYETGDLEAAASGRPARSQGLINDVPPVRRARGRIVAEAEAIIHARLAGLVLSAGTRGPGDVTAGTPGITPGDPGAAAGRTSPEWAPGELVDHDPAASRTSKPASSARTKPAQVIGLRGADGSRGTTNATICSPRSSCGAPTTAASRTPGCPAMLFSSSSG